MEYLIVRTLAKVFHRSHQIYIGERLYHGVDTSSTRVISFFYSILNLHAGRHVSCRKPRYSALFCCISAVMRLQQLHD
jgi:hypothetical protein